MKIILCLILLASCAAPPKEKYIEVDYPDSSVYYPVLKGSKLIKKYNGKYYIPRNKIEKL